MQTGFEFTSARREPKVEDQPIQQPMAADKKIRRKPSTDQKKVRRKMRTTKQASGTEENPMHREAQILNAMAHATADEQAVLAAELNEIRRARREAVAEERSLDFANAVVSAVKTPVRTHERSTTQTDWLGKVAITTEAKAEDEHRIRAQATQWFNGLHEAVVADDFEFAEQAKGQARAATASYDEAREPLMAAYLDTAERLRVRAGYKTADAVEDSEAGEDLSDRDAIFGDEEWANEEGEAGTVSEGARKVAINWLPADEGYGRPMWVGGDYTIQQFSNGYALDKRNGGWESRVGVYDSLEEAKQAAEGGAGGSTTESSLRMGDVVADQTSLGPVCVACIETMDTIVERPLTRAAVQHAACTLCGGTLATVKVADNPTEGWEDPDTNDIERYKGSPPGFETPGDEQSGNAQSGNGRDDDTWVDPLSDNRNNEPAFEEQFDDGREVKVTENYHKGARRPRGSVRRVTASRPLYEIAAEIEQEWGNVNYAARPYLDAMKELSSVNDMFFQDPASHIVRYFLSNARSFSGERAKAIKAELKGMLGTTSSRKRSMHDIYDDAYPSGYVMEKFHDHSGDPIVIGNTYKVLGTSIEGVAVGSDSRHTNRSMMGSDGAVILQRPDGSMFSSRGRVGGNFNLIPVTEGAGFPFPDPQDPMNTVGPDHPGYRASRQQGERRQAAYGDPCGRCGGSGYVREFLYTDDYGDPQFGTIDCSSCGGSGTQQDVPEYPMADDPLLTDRYSKRTQATGYADYGWIVTSEWDGDGNPFKDVYYAGPSNIDPATEALLKSGKGQAFQLWDDDGVLMCRGRWIPGEGDNDPLFDFGMAMYGCTRMTIKNNQSYVGSTESRRVTAFRNKTDVEVPAEFHPMLELLEDEGYNSFWQGEGGYPTEEEYWEAYDRGEDIAHDYWAYTNPGWWFPTMEAHTAHEPTAEDILRVIRQVEPHDCPRCTGVTGSSMASRRQAADGEMGGEQGEAWPWELPEEGAEEAQGAADVEDVATPGQSPADYPQPNTAKVRAFRARVQANLSNA